MARAPRTPEMDETETGNMGNNVPFVSDVDHHETGTDVQILGPEIKPREQRKHRATYAKDKKKGGYIVRVIGPNATDFAGRQVPVTLANGGEQIEMLDTLVWSGIDAGMPAKGGRPEIKGTGQPAALYTFVPKPKTAREVDF